MGRLGVPRRTAVLAVAVALASVVTGYAHAATPLGPPPGVAVNDPPTLGVALGPSDNCSSLGVRVPWPKWQGQPPAFPKSEDLPWDQSWGDTFNALSPGVYAAPVTDRLKYGTYKVSSWANCQGGQQLFNTSFVFGPELTVSSDHGRNGEFVLEILSTRFRSVRLQVGSGRSASRAVVKLDPAGDEPLISIARVQFFQTCAEAGKTAVTVTAAGASQPASTTFRGESCRRDRWGVGLGGPQRAGRSMLLALTDGWARSGERGRAAWAYRMCLRGPGIARCWRGKRPGRVETALKRTPPLRAGRYTATYFGEGFRGVRKFKVRRSRGTAAPRPVERFRCERGAREARINGRTVCLAPGDGCTPGSELDYRRYGFTCFTQTRTRSGRGVESVTTIHILRRL